MLKRMVYRSRATRPMNAADLNDLLVVSRANNGRDRISGMLVHAEGRFLQALEGPEAAVDAAWARISADPRHDEIEVLDERTVTARVFADWTMGYADAVCADIGSVLALSDLAELGDARLDPAGSLRVLEHFAPGEGVREG